jgi:Transglycosylase SLT domain
MPRLLAMVALLLVLAAAPAEAATARTLALAEVRAPTGGLVVRAGQGPFIYPARGPLAMLVGSSRIVRHGARREAVLTRVSLLGGRIRASRIVVPARGLAGASVEGLIVDGVPFPVRANTLVPLGGKSYVIALQQAVAADTDGSRVGIVGLRVHLGARVAGLAAGSELWVGIAAAALDAPARGVQATDEIPPRLIPIYQRAGARYGVPWVLLASINKFETDFGANLSVSSAGAVGWMQFLPSTWRKYAVDATGDGKADPYSPRDAINSAARYLAAAGVRRNLAQAVWSYNHSLPYVRTVIAQARLYARSSIGDASGPLDPSKPGS